jgi:hypothetical protein
LERFRTGDFGLERERRGEGFRVAAKGGAMGLEKGE